MSPYEWKILEWDENPQTNIYKKHIAASVKERAQTLLVPLEEIWYLKPSITSISNRQTLLSLEKMPFVYSTLFSVLYTMFLEKKIKLDVFMPRSMHLHTEIYTNLKSISELYKMYMRSLDSFILALRDNWVSLRYCCSMTGYCFFLKGGGLFVCLFVWLVGFFCMFWNKHFFL